MRLRSIAAAAAALIALGGSALATETGDDATAPLGLSCTAPTDSAALAAQLSNANSPMAPYATTIVDAASAADIDPRAIVAIAAHETLLETYLPSQEINNPFGLGPGWSFANEGAAIERAVAVLDRYYFAEGRDTPETIGPKWAPIGADNDPSGLNNHWVTGVSRYYSALGADTELPMRLSTQDPAPDCGAAIATDDGLGPAIITLWNPKLVPAAGRRMSQGGDPITGEPATPLNFAFPLAPRANDEVLYADPVADDSSCHEHASGCAVNLVSHSGVTVVAAGGGVLSVADPLTQSTGIGFWIEQDNGDRFGYSPLAAYADGIVAGVTVRPGDRLGTGTGAMLIAWERNGVRINPHALLQATRPAG